jgi:DNA-binding response OmpR family regulator
MNRERPRVMIVEDDEFAAAVIARLFERWGCDSLTYGTLARAIISLDIPFDLIILDVRLPDGDGVGLLRAVHDLGIDVKVVIWSAYSNKDRHDLMELKPYLMLAKPTSLDALEALASEVRRGFVTKASDGS